MARRLPPSLSTLPLSVCPWRAFYPSPVRISMARRLPTSDLPEQQDTKTALPSTPASAPFPEYMRERWDVASLPGARPCRVKRADKMQVQIARWESRQNHTRQGPIVAPPDGVFRDRRPHRLSRLRLASELR